MGLERPDRPRAWWRLSIYPGCDPCVTVREDEAELWRSEGLTVIELGDVAAERERCIEAVFRWGHDQTPGALFSAPAAVERIVKRL